MFKILVLLFVTYLALNAGKLSDAYGDVNKTMEIDKDFGLSSNRNLVGYKNDSNITIKRNNYGYDGVADLNLSRPNDQYKYVRDNIENFPSAGNANAQAIANQTPMTQEAFGTDQSKLTVEYMKSRYDINSSKVLAGSMQGLKTLDVLRSQFAGRNKIDCFISRELTTSFYCPLPSKSDSFFIGGDVKSSKAEKQKECDDWCRVPIKCKSLEIATPTSSFSKKETYSINKPFSLSATSLKINPEGKLKFINFEFAITGGSDEVKEKAFKDGLVIPFDIETKDKGDSAFHSYIRDYRINAKSSNFIYSVPIRSNRIAEMRFVPFAPHVLRGNSGISPLPSSMSVKLTNVSIEYMDDKYWFCPPESFVTTANECEGEIKTLVIANSPIIVCIPKKKSTGEPKYNAFYTKDSCERTCFERETCLPTYRHLTTAGALLDPTSFFNIQYGCKDTPGNEGCTQAKCAAFLNAHTMPFEEVIYVKDNKKVYTVQNSVATNNAPRPRYDLSLEMSSNGDVAAKKKAMKNSEKDISYKNMISDNTFNISAKKIKDVYPALYNMRNINHKLGLVLEYIPQSNWVFDNKWHYFYVVVEMLAAYEDVGNGSKFQDYNYAILDTSKNWKVIKRKERGLVWHESTKDWVPYASPSEKYVTLNSSSGELVNYSKSTTAPYTFKKKFSDDFISYEYVLSTSIATTLPESDGVMIRSQKTKNGHLKKIYTGAKDSTGANMNDYKLYLIESPTRLKYEQIVAKLKPKTVIYHKLMSSKYTKGLGSHGQFDRDRVKMYVQGTPSRMSVYGVFTPHANEENKKGFIFNFLLKK